MSEVQCRTVAELITALSEYPGDLMVVGGFSLSPIVTRIDDHIVVSDDPRDETFDDEESTDEESHLQVVPDAHHSLRDIPLNLHRLAAEIESGNVETPATLVVIYGSARWTGVDGDDLIEQTTTELEAFGKRIDTFTIKGLLHEGLQRNIHTRIDSVEEQVGIGD